MALTPAEHRRRYRASEKGRAENRERMRRRRERLRSCGQRAGEIMRKQVNWLGWACCHGCGEIHLAAGIEIDHVWPLGFGGCDTPENVQPLCIPCHRLKTSIEAMWP